MKACMTASGGVMFIPEEIERATAKKSDPATPVNYDDIAGERSEQPDRQPLTGKREEDVSCAA